MKHVDLQNKIVAAKPSDSMRFRVWDAQNKIFTTGPISRKRALGITRMGDTSRFQVVAVTAVAKRTPANFEGRVTDGGTEHGYAIYSNVDLG